MPVLSKGNLKIDYTEDGVGQTIILIHSSISNNQQWRLLVNSLRDRFHVLAINLFGYGQTSPWTGNSNQTLYDQAKLVIELCSTFTYPISIVGHSFGGSVGIKLATILKDKVVRMVLLEPNPFYLLNQHGRIGAYNESLELRNCIKRFGSKGEWGKVAEKFADYFLADHSWEGMPEKHRQTFIDRLLPNFHEWDAVMNEETTSNELKDISAKTLIVSGSNTRRIFREIVELLSKVCPNWTFTELAKVGHAAPITHTAKINKVIEEFLDCNL